MLNRQRVPVAVDVYTCAGENGRRLNLKIITANYELMKITLA